MKLLEIIEPVFESENTDILDTKLKIVEQMTEMCR